MTGRIFGIGLSRTGTKSLHAAAVILGLAAAHYPPLRYAIRWMDGQFGPDTCGPYTLLSDVPVPAYYRDFDRAIPGSRFILTVRDEEAWLDSIEAHYRRSGPSHAGTGHRDLYRMATFGTFAFQRERFRDVFRQHNEGARHHFRDRRADLLVLDVARDDDPWGSLATFLGEPRPDLPFPSFSDRFGGEPLDLVPPRDLAAKRARLMALVAAGEGARVA
jgi:hypothetical protein